MRARALILISLILLLALAAALRGFRSHMLLDLAAFALALGTSLVLAWALVRSLRRTGSSRSVPAKPRWYAFSPNAFGLCVLIVLAAWWVFRIPAGMGNGPAGPQVSAAKFEKPWREGPVVLLALGDSVSTGFGAGPGLGYFDLLRKNRDDVYPEMRGLELSRVMPNISAMRLARDATNSMEHENVINCLPVASAETFGVVCITTGGIDLIHNYGRSAPREGAMFGADIATARPWIENFERRLERMMETLAKKFPGGCAVFMATIFDPTDGEGDIENGGPLFWISSWEGGYDVFNGFNDAFKRVDAKYAHVHLVDVHKVMLGHGIHCRHHDNPNYHEDDPTYWYYFNLEDPNRRGYDAIRRAFLNAMIEALAPATARD